jgi:DNA-binding LacI/PurR family transcriptional regulator
VITFDNYPQFLCLPVTTVDFGFDHLGRAALHTILGDIPVRRDAHGNVPSRPFIVHWGSVGRPRRKRTVALPS